MTTTEELDEDDQPYVLYFISLLAAQSVFLFPNNLYHTVSFFYQNQKDVGVMKGYHWSTM